MSDKYHLSQSDTKEAYRRKVSPQDRENLQRRAEAWASIGGPGRAGLHKQARAAYQLYLDFTSHAIGGDFPRWLSVHSGVPHKTCYRRLKAGQALAVGVKTNRNQSGLLSELRERETTPQPSTLDWD